MPEPQQGLASARKLFASTDPNWWFCARQNYKAAIASLDKPDLAELDEDVSNNYPGRDMTPSELSKVMQWKLKKGTFRPGLLQKAESNNKATLRNAWLAAGMAIAAKEGEPDSIVIAIKILSKQLFGVGPATASALLAPRIPELCAFMSDEAIVACKLFAKKVDIKYDVKTFGQFNQKMIEKAAILRDMTGKMPWGDQLWTAEDVQRALWAECVLPTATGAATRKMINALRSVAKPSSKRKHSDGDKESLFMLPTQLAGLLEPSPSVTYPTLLGGRWGVDGEKELAGPEVPEGEPATKRRKQK